MHWAGVLLVIQAIFACISPAMTSELIFYLNNGEKQCFFEHIEMESWIRLNYYVLRGGDFHVGVTLRSPDGRVLYDRPYEAFDSAAIMVAQSGVHSLCFFSARAISGAKCVSFELEVAAPAQQTGDASAEEDERVDETALSDRLAAISSNLDSVATTQTFLRHRASVDTTRATDVNLRVTWWAILQSAAIITVGTAQLLIIRKPFEVLVQPRI